MHEKCIPCTTKTPNLLLRWPCWRPSHFLDSHTHPALRHQRNEDQTLVRSHSCPLSVPDYNATRSSNRNFVKISQAQCICSTSCSGQECTSISGEIRESSTGKSRQPCSYKYVYVILCIQSCPILHGINILSSTILPIFIYPTTNSKIL
jgi:hypothetical protein